ncbi:MAG: hypothetical protein ABUL62_01025 [Myxococcales bacterium]
MKASAALVLVGGVLAGCGSSDKLLGSDGSTVMSGGSGGAPEVTFPPRAVLGAPCVPADEWVSDFRGFSVNEVNIDDRAPQCETNFCIVNHFQGRATCPYGQVADAGDCLVPDGSQPVTVSVDAQLVSRQANVAAVCSCRCDGDGPGPYCTCPESMQCEHLVDDLHLSNDSYLAGSYCIPKGSQYDSSMRDGPLCVAPNCGPAHPN